MKIITNSQNRIEVKDDMIGLFFEDINYSLDGGLHAEMIENRNFEAVIAYGGWDDYHTTPDSGYAWSNLTKTGRMEYHTDRPMSSANPHYLRFFAQEAGDGFGNKAYDGLYLEKGKEYKISFYARCVAYSGMIKVMGVPVTLDSDSWKKYEMFYVAPETAEGVKFEICLDAPGVLDFDMISMMPADAVYGIFRRDLADMLKELKPGFLRFPGGCIIEGNNLDNRYQWKLSLGRPEDRVFNWNRWAVHGTSPQTDFHGPYSHYGQTLGVGYYEYFLLCEYIGAKPLPVMNVGLACQYQSTEQVAIDSPQMKQFIQDALDLIEFANGDASTLWGGMRAQMGHPQPFGMEMLGIGNEQWQTEKVDFFGRYLMFEKAIHDCYPDIKLIGSAGPNVQSKTYEDAWNFIRPEAEKRENPESFVYAVDEHYYVKPEWLCENVHFYDNYPRSVKVFAGEYAAHVDGACGMNRPDSNTWGAALAEASFLTGVEQNADVVVLASYAPLFGRLGYSQWSPNLIWFDAKDVYGTPSYYVQQMYSCYRGNQAVETKAEGEGIYASTTIDIKENIAIIKLANATDEAQDISLALDFAIEANATVFELTGDKAKANNMNHAENIVPSKREMDLSGNVYHAKPYSFQVIMCKLCQ